MTVIDWLLDADPSIRWQVLRDLTDATDDEVAAERARVAVEGWGAQLLALQGPDGQWDGGTYRPGWVDESKPFFDAWTATTFSLLLLRDLGADPDDPAVQRAVALVRDNARWEATGELFFEGETEPCINGSAASIGAYFGQDVDGIVDRLLLGQLEDGGWNCWAEFGATVSSFHSTICVLEGLLAWERAGGSSADVAAARERGDAYLLERGLLRRRSNGRIVDPRFTMFSFPTRWFYDALRGLEYFRAIGPRTGRAVRRGDRARHREAGRGRLLAAREHAHGPDPFRDGGPGRLPQPLEHLARDARAALGRVRTGA